MNEIRYTLLGDGSSDKALIPLLNWLLREHYENYAIQPTWAELHLKRGARGLSERIRKSVELYPCDLLFVHRDAENQSLSNRVERDPGRSCKYSRFPKACRARCTCSHAGIMAFVR